MDKRISITLNISGHRRVISASAILIDLAWEFGNADLAAGLHEIIILIDGSIMLNGSLYWQPKASTVEPKKKAG